MDFDDAIKRHTSTLDSKGYGGYSYGIVERPEAHRSLQPKLRFRRKHKFRVKRPLITSELGRPLDWAAF